MDGYQATLTTTPSIYVISDFCDGRRPRKRPSDPSRKRLTRGVTRPSLPARLVMSQIRVSGSPWSAHRTFSVCGVSAWIRRC